MKLFKGVDSFSSYNTRQANIIAESEKKIYLIYILSLAAYTKSGVPIVSLYDVTVKTFCS